MRLFPSILSLAVLLSVSSYGQTAGSTAGAATADTVMQARGTVTEYSPGSRS